MAQPYVGEIRLFAGNFAPAGWMFCSGQTLPISENEVLFQLIGTTYGGDGEETFALPDLQSRVPIHMGNGYTIGQTVGQESVTLTQNQIPSHNHQIVATTALGSETSPAGNVLAQLGSGYLYSASAVGGSLAPQSVASDGGSQPHENCQPFVCVNYIISLFGIFPSQT